jgi:hypothetical protein
MLSHRSCGGDGGGDVSCFHHQNHRHPVKRQQEIFRVGKKKTHFNMSEIAPIGSIMLVSYYSRFRSK